MADREIDDKTVAALSKLESEIAQKFQTMLANDAMLALELNFQEVVPADRAELQQRFSDPVQLIRSGIQWNDAQGIHFFFFRDEDANALLAQITTQNDALDSLDVLFDNWNIGAQEVLNAQEIPIEFDQITLDTRPLNEEDIPEQSYLITYQLKFDGNEYDVFRLVPGFWLDIAEAAGLEVTVVEETETGGTAGDGGGTVDVENVDFGELQRENTREDSVGSIEMLYDLKLDVVVELGRTRKPIREILDLGRGSIIELEKLAGDPVEIYINDKKLAEGEVVVVDDHFGVRITNLLKPADRIRTLGES